MGRHDWFDEILNECNPERWFTDWQRSSRSRRGRREPVFESGEMKFIILRMIREKPRHGYEVIKELEERFAGWYSPSPGTVYPTLQLLEDQGYVRAEEQEGKRVYHITAEGEAFLDEHRDTVEEILDRVRDTLRSVFGGSLGDLNEAFAGLAREVYREAWRRGADEATAPRIVEILKRAAAEIRALRERPAA